MAFAPTSRSTVRPLGWAPRRPGPAGPPPSACRARASRSSSRRRCCRRRRRRRRPRRAPAPAATMIDERFLSVAAADLLRHAHDVRRIHERDGQVLAARAADLLGHDALGADEERHVSPARGWPPPRPRPRRAGRGRRPGRRRPRGGSGRHRAAQRGLLRLPRRRSPACPCSTRTAGTRGASSFGSWQFGHRHSPGALQVVVGPAAVDGGPSSDGAWDSASERSPWYSGPPRAARGPRWASRGPRGYDDPLSKHACGAGPAARPSPPRAGRRRRPVLRLAPQVGHRPRHSSRQSRLHRSRRGGSARGPSPRGRAARRRSR